MYDVMPIALDDMCPSYSTVKNWVARFRTGHLSKRRPTQETIPGNVYAIHSMIQDNQRISAKKR
jgi:hypothetical protein